MQNGTILFYKSYLSLLEIIMTQTQINGFAQYPVYINKENKKTDYQYLN